MESYLSDRTQFVSMDDTNSDAIGVDVGVPQGSILGPLLFIIYVNDLPNASELLESILFADDTSLFSSFATFTLNSMIDIKKINTELDHVFSWLCANKLSLNVSKTKYMIFNNKYNPHPNPTERLKINNISIDLVSEFNFLGVTIDNELNWVAHTQKINSKTSRTLGILKKLKRIAPLSVLTTLYSTMILTNFTYGIKAWGFAHSKLSTIQKKNYPYYHK